MCNQHSTDTEILDGMRNKEEGAVKALNEKYFNAIVNFIISKNGSYDEAKDIAQYAVIAFYQKVLEPEFVLTVSIKTYICSIAIKRWLKELVRTGKIVTTEDSLDNKLIDDLKYDELEKNENKKEKEDLIKRCMKHFKDLGEHCQKILIHVFWDKWSMDEIAEEMKYTNADNVKNQKARCMKRLRESCAHLKKYSHLS